MIIRIIIIAIFIFVIFIFGWGKSERNFPIVITLIPFHYFINNQFIANQFKLKVTVLINFWCSRFYYTRI